MFIWDPNLAYRWLSTLRWLGICFSDFFYVWNLKNFIQENAFEHVACKMASALTHWGRVTHICVSRLSITGSDNGLSPGRRQAIIWTNAGILLIGPLGTNFSENLIKILPFLFTKMRLKVSSAKWRPFCLGLNVLIWMLPTRFRFYCEI